MNDHLSEESWAAAVLDPSDPAVAEHLQGCAECRAEVSSFTEAINAARAVTLRAAERPESFWRAQRLAITERTVNRTFPSPWKRLAWVAATVILVVLSTTVVSRRNTPSLRTRTTRVETDDALLLSVQQSIQSDLPQALEPAELLTEEINRAAVSRKSR